MASCDPSKAPQRRGELDHGIVHGVPCAGGNGVGGRHWIGRLSPLRPSLRTIFSMSWATAAMQPPQSTLHNPRNRERARPRSSREAKIPSTTVRRRRVRVGAR